MTPVYTITVGSRWKPNGHFYLYGHAGNSTFLPAEVLALQLFCWDHNTFYGTLCETTDIDGVPCIALSSKNALDIFSSLLLNDLLEIEWEEETILVQKAAKIMHAAIKNGDFIPDFKKWKSGILGWNLLFPDAQTSEQEWEKLKTQLPFLAEWLQHIFSDLLSQMDAMSQIDTFPTAWQHVRKALPLLQAFGDHSNWIDEDDWLIAIGWKKDTSPYRSVLQLLEPVDDDAWQLNILLQDTENPDIMHPFNANKPMEEQNFPTTWYGHADRIRKDIQVWIQLVPWLSKQQYSHDLLYELSNDQAYEFLESASDRLIHQGYTILLPSWWKELQHAKPKLKMNFKSSPSSQQANFGLQQLMQFDWKLAIGNIEMNEEEFQIWFEQKNRLLKFRGNWIALDSVLLKQVRQIMKQVKKKEGFSFRDVLEMYLLQSANMDPALSITISDAMAAENQNSAGEAQKIQLEVLLNQHLLGLMQQLSQVKSIPVVSTPETFNGTLRKYQAEGVAWLLFLRSLGMGGCLADDMGLGKTIQWINYLLHVDDDKHKQDPIPSLLICPTSVLGNWQKEIARFAPTLSVYVHHGPTRKKGDDFTQAALAADVVLTSYTLAQLDEEDLTSCHWNAVCLDEAQNIKNVYTKQRTAIQHLHANHRVAMTGTPMENRLTELWSIYDFMNPGYLGSIRSFQARFVNPIEKDKDPIRIEQVKRLVQPFLLRRVKNSPEIELDLPEKQESKLYVSLTVEQAALYESVIHDMFERLKTASGMERRGLILATLTKIKQLCNHPALMLKEHGSVGWKNRTNKIERLLEMIKELRQEGDSCLIFTQFVEMGHLLKTTIEKELQESVLFLHGGTPKLARDQMITQFQDRTLPLSEQRHIFLLSLKAGGVGLNLTSANHVFHFDRWWNPAVENQATDRAFRIGQTRHVHVFKFITLGTLEERIDELIERKQSLNQQIISGGENWITEMSTDDLHELFALRNEWVEAEELDQ